MANHKSAAKRARQTIKRTERNRFYKTRLKNITKSVRVAVENGNAEEAQSAFIEANKSIHSFVSKGILKKQTASRRVSRLAKLVQTLDNAS